MIGESSGVTLKVVSDAGPVTSEQAVSIGLIVTELVINALKHAFPAGSKTGSVSVSYNVKNEDWILSVSDNGGGIQNVPAKRLSGLGTTLVKALAQQLGGEVKTTSAARGTTVSIARAATQTLAPVAA